MTASESSSSSAVVLLDQALAALKNLANGASNYTPEQSSASEFRRRVGELLRDFVDEFRSKGQSSVSSLPEQSLRYLIDAVYSFMRDRTDFSNLNVDQIGSTLSDFEQLIEAFHMASEESGLTGVYQIFGPISRRAGRLKDELSSVIKLDSLDGRSAELSTNLAQLAEERRQHADAISRAEALVEQTQGLTSQLQLARGQSQQLADEFQLAQEQSKQLAEQVRLAQVQIEAATKKAAEAEERLAASEQRTDILNEPKSAEVLVTHFETFKESHQGRSSKFFKSGLGVLGLAMTVAVVSAFWFTAHDFNVGSFAWRFAVVTGSAGVGTYLLRQATYHRSIAVWADAIKVQLQTFDSYTALVGSDSQRDVLRSEFAKRVFGNEPTGSKSADSDVSLTDVSSLIDSLAKLNRTSSAG